MFVRRKAHHFLKDFVHLQKFFKEFNRLSGTHKFSKAARNDALKNFLKSLPVPKNIRVKPALPFLANGNLIEFTAPHCLYVDI